MTMILKEKKAEDFATVPEVYYPGKQFTICEVASFIGTLVSGFREVEFGPYTIAIL